MVAGIYAEHLAVQSIQGAARHGADGVHPVLRLAGGVAVKRLLRLRHILPDAAAEHDVQKLVAPAHAQHGPARRQKGARQRKFRFVARSVHLLSLIHI